MKNEEFLKDVCPNHTEKSKWNRSELLHILKMHEKQLLIQRVIVSFDEGYEKGWREATTEACTEIAKNYQPNER